MPRSYLLPSAMVALAPLAGGLAAQAQGPGRALTARAQASEITYGQRVQVVGQLAQDARPLGGRLVEAQQRPARSPGFVAAAVTRTADDGSYAFARLRPGRNTLYRVVERGVGGAVSPTVPVIVDPSHRLIARSRGRGNTRLAVTIRHTRELASPPVTAFWFVARENGRRFRLVARTRTRELGAGRTYASTTIDPPARHFVFRVCLNPRWGTAMGPPSAHRRCHHHGYSIAVPVR